MCKMSSSLPLDARAILEYLNELGYRNITSEQLKEFMKDLQKLIKHGERMEANTDGRKACFDELFRRTTVSCRAKQNKENRAASKDNQVAGKTITPVCTSGRGGGGVVELGENNAKSSKEQGGKNGPCRSVAKPCDKWLCVCYQPVAKWTGNAHKTNNTCVRPRPELPTTSRGRATPNSFVHPAECGEWSGKSVLIPQRRIADDRGRVHRNDPVKLYQYYQCEWNHFQNRFPGETPHSNLRWQVRRKLLDPK